MASTSGMDDFSCLNQRRKRIGQIKNTRESLMLKIEIGHEANLLNPPLPGATNQLTHRWTVFLRGFNQTPLKAVLVKSVVFTLHNSFNNPRRCNY